MNIRDQEIEKMIPSPSEHPTIIALTCLFFIVAGSIWEPYLGFVGLFFVAMLWSECMKWVNWATEIRDRRSRYERKNRIVRDAVDTGKIDETIEEFRQLQKEIPNSKGGGQFIQKKRDRDRWFELDCVIDALYESKEIKLQTCTSPRIRTD